jgi:hypothetical protein
MVVGTYTYVIASFIFGLIGGFAHDLVQNKRIWQKPVKNAAGEVFIGSLAGLFLGGISGLIVGLVLPPDTSSMTAAYTGLTAGIAFKGLTEGASTAQPPQGQ